MLSSMLFMPNKMANIGMHSDVSSASAPLTPVIPGVGHGRGAPWRDLLESEKNG